MDSLYNLTEEEEDTLKELVNISFGLSASLIADMIGECADLKLPKLSIINIDQLERTINDDHHNVAEDERYVITQTFHTQFSGETLFIMNESDAKTLANLVIQEEGLCENEVESVMMEISNIITSSAIGKICDMFKERALFDPPYVQKKISNHLIEKNKYTQFHKVIILYTALDLPQRNIYGSMYIMINDTLFQWIKASLREFL